jgi:chemotaxis protein CheD
LWHPVRRFGSISHFVLPSGRADADVPGKYGRGAFEQQKKDLLRHGVNIRQCVVKIIGGGKMFAHSETQGIGTKNINMAKELVAQEGLMITAEDVGNAGYRRLYFDVDSGAVWIKFDWLDGGQEDRML